ncbi:MAG: ATP-binding cassette domain-containing protein [Acidobacteria bacterium]|nr:ATP-binding cassette domain-containing protein [Acidobacteriota bacterium]
MLETERLTVHVGGVRAIDGVSLNISAGTVTAVIGPTGCGKSTLLRTINRMISLLPSVRIEGDVRLQGASIFTSGLRVTDLRRRVGLVGADTALLPGTVMDNMTYGLRVSGQWRTERARLTRVEEALREVHLWDEVKDQLDGPAEGLTAGQRRRLTMARALALGPELLLLDDPAAGLDPVATQRIESLIYTLRQRLTIVLVTNSVRQAARVSDQTAFLWLGRLVECSPTARVFTTPAERLTEDYVTGRCG